jgi:hypothetical protein
MSKPETQSASISPTFRRLGVEPAEPVEVEERPEAQVMLLLMQAASDVVGEVSARRIWDRAAEAGLYDQPRSFRRAWCRARSPFWGSVSNVLKWGRSA